MKRFKYSLVFSIVFLSFLFRTGFSQQPAAPVNAKSFIDKGVKLFFEKVYLHFDRQVYASGEDIWFKAYLVNGQSNWLTNTSNNLYVELISPGSKLLDRKVIRLENGTGAGDFQLKDSVPEGKYRIRAYTSWMRNFRNCFIFEKDIDIHSTSGIKPKTKPTIPDTTKYEVHFFPEGGSLVADVASIVGFKAVDVFGNGCDVKGQIISSDGDTVGMFQSIHLGMGRFSFLPVNNKKYYAWVSVKNKAPFKTEFPNVLPRGFAMRINNNDTSSISVIISTNQETFNEFKDQEMVFLGQAYGKNCYTAKVKPSNLQFGVKIPKSYFPNGIASITLLDNNLKPHCQRLAYVEKKANYSLSVVSNKKSYKSREEVVLNVKALDAQKRPVKANLSLAVVDANQVPDQKENIVSYLFLQSEIKGKIEKPAQYFDTTNVNRLKQMDLLLLTQGWRDFVWKQLQDSAIRIKYLMEPGITISGNVRQKIFNKPIPGASITLFISGGKPSLLQTQTDSLGRYYVDGVNFYGNKHIILTSSQKGKKVGWILRDSAIFPKPITIPYRPDFDVVKPEIKLFADEADSRKNALKKYTLADTISLSAVVVSAISQKSEKERTQHIMEGGNVDYDFTISPEDYSLTGIGAFLMLKVPGAQPSSLTGDNAGDSPDRVAFRSMGELLKPIFILDQLTLSDQDDYAVYNLSMEQIKRVLISRTNVMASSITDRNRYVISVITKSGAYDKKEFATLSDYIDGYYQARVFYSPKYTGSRREGERPDLRTTIYWNNNVLTNENGEATVTFNNTDKPTAIRASAEGITDKGVPVAAAVRYEVK
jgi:hypothetical protein